MAINFVILNALLFGVAFAQQSGQQSLGAAADDCLMKCLNEMYRKAPGVDAMKLIDVKPIRVGANATAMCPHLNDTSQMDKPCGAMKDMKKCCDACPDTHIKKMTMSGFTGVQFLCIDRADDVKKNQACITRTCPDVQGQCVPKCGSVEDSTAKIMTLLQKVRASAVAGGPSAATGQNEDTAQIAQVVGQSCTTLACLTQCTEAPLTEKCGKDAYLLQRDFIWTMFSQTAQSMFSMGLQMQLPKECAAVLPANATAALGAQAVPPAAPGATPPVGNSSVPGATTPIAPVGTSPVPGAIAPVAPEGSSPAAVGTSPVAPVAGPNETVPAVVAHEEPSTGAASTPTPTAVTLPPADDGKKPPSETAQSKECEKPPCKGTMGILPSTLLVVISMALVMFW